MLLRTVRYDRDLKKDRGIVAPEETGPVSCPGVPVSLTPRLPEGTFRKNTESGPESHAVLRRESVRPGLAGLFRAGDSAYGLWRAEMKGRPVFGIGVTPVPGVAASGLKSERWDIPAPVTEAGLRDFWILIAGPFNLMDKILNKYFTLQDRS